MNFFIRATIIELWHLITLHFRLEPQSAKLRGEHRANSETVAYNKDIKQAKPKEGNRKGNTAYCQHILSQGNISENEQLMNLMSRYSPGTIEVVGYVVEPIAAVCER